MILSDRYVQVSQVENGSEIGVLPPDYSEFLEWHDADRRLRRLSSKGGMPRWHFTSGTQRWLRAKHKPGVAGRPDATQFSPDQRLSQPTHHTRGPIELSHPAGQFQGHTMRRRATRFSSG